LTRDALAYRRVEGSSDKRRMTLRELASLGEVSAEIAHELRNALLVISASAYLAARDPGASAPHLAKIERNTRAAQSIVDGMLALVRGDALVTEELQLQAVLADARAGLGDGAAIFEDHVDNCIIHAHAALLPRVFRCLYENASQASAPATPRIITTATREGARTVIEVSDDGPGVPEAIAGSVFEPLVSAREGGTGLGLSLCRRIVAAHHGVLSLEPAAQGARFRVVF